jgi:hypothetical protein
MSTYADIEALTEEEVHQGTAEWNKERRQHNKQTSYCARDTEEADVEQPSDDQTRKKDDAVLPLFSAGAFVLRKGHIPEGIQSRRWFRSVKIEWRAIRG